MNRPEQGYIRYFLSRELSNAALALGSTYGFCLGILPKATMQWGILFMMVFILRVNLVVTFGVALIAWAFSGLIYPWLDLGGLYLLTEIPSLQQYWRAIYHAPLLPYFQLTNALVLGSMLFCLVMMPLTFWAALKFFTKYRETLRFRISQSYLWRVLATPSHLRR